MREGGEWCGECDREGFVFYGVSGSLGGSFEVRGGFCGFFSPFFPFFSVCLLRGY